MRTLIKNAKIITSTDVIKGCCAFTDGIIDYVGSEEVPADKVIDANGGYVTPGFIDIHCHGGANLEFMDASVEEIGKIVEFHKSHGTTTIFPTTLAADEGETLEALDNLVQFVKDNPNSTVAGVHLEGPWLNPLQCGAQNTSYMKLPDAEYLKSLKEKYPFICKVGAAPELEGGAEFGDMGKKLGIVMSPAHTDGSFTDMEEALKHGYSIMTHLYSGMKGTERKNAFRIAGAVEAGLYFDAYYVEIIADGKHLPPELLKYIYKIKGADRICMITDAIRASGLPNGAKTKIGSLKRGLDVIVEDDVAKMPDRQSFAGSTATTDRLFKTMAQAIGTKNHALVDIAKMSSLTPAKVMGLTDRGEIAVGKIADLVILDTNFDLVEVITAKKNA
jgi:N-acetylglucosamine-6-phosphate deacetylase